MKAQYLLHNAVSDSHHSAVLFLLCSQMLNERRYWTQLATEAVATGVLVVPLAQVTARLLPNNQFAQLFVAGAAFHLIAEATGMNEWYVRHGAASRWDWRSFHRSAHKTSTKARTECQQLLKCSQRCSLVVLPGLRSRPGNASTLVK